MEKIEEFIEEFARDSFSVHHFPAQYRTNLSWESCSQDVKDWHIRNAAGLFMKGYRKWTLLNI